jgi:hypothetical protein
MTTWFAAPLAAIFVLATLTWPPSLNPSQGKPEKESSEQTDKGTSKEKSGKAEEGPSAVSKGKRHRRTERQE